MSHPEITVGCGEFTYRPQSDWARWPAEWQVSEVTGVATDSLSRVFVFNRGSHPVAVFSPEGEPLFAWGTGIFTRPHGIWIGPDDAVYLTDDLDHTVHKYTSEGERLWTLGTSGQPSETGATSVDYRTIRQAGPPFHYPTNLALAPSGDMYISDGYGNARIHRFSADGKLIHSWGEPGSGPGQFQIPHGIAVAADGTVYVADRENSRLQLFSPEGKYLTEWKEIARPCEMVIDAVGNVYVAELGYRAGMWPGTSLPHENATGGRVSIFDKSGKLLSRFGGGEHPSEPGDFFAPHDIWLDSQGSLYVSEVCRSAARGKKPAGRDYHTLQKFVKEGVERRAS